jgi:NAD(P)-dependent dehydrogenase (short-subunit alcohol dehydrogenase family)
MMPRAMDPNGKVAIISGGASGIGLATAKLLARRGARVVLADLQVAAGEAAAQEIAASGGDARFCKTDVTQRDDLRALLDFAANEFGRIDICHNNAGVNEGGQDFFAPGADYWERTVAIDLAAVLRATQLEVQRFREQGGGGVIVNTASMGGMVPMPTSPIYAASKAGVIHFSRSLGYLAAEGIRVNAICPTFTDTPMVRGGGEPALEFMRNEVGGILRPEQVAEGVLELIRDDSRAGAVMRVTVRKGLDYTFERR